MTQTKHPLEDYVWIFVGCGGTFYAASPYLAVLYKRYHPDTLILMDPNVVKDNGQDRQWPGWNPGISKVSVAEEALIQGDRDFQVINLVDKFNLTDSMLCKHTEGKPVIAIVNVDNNEARLDVARWLADRCSDGIMIVSGCERTFGQCYPGIWKDGEPVYDWRESHRDVVQGSSSFSDNPCNAQNVRANALTGVLVGMCIEDVAQMIAREWYTVQEFYWDIRSGSLRMWTTFVPCKRKGVVV